MNFYFKSVFWDEMSLLGPNGFGTKWPWDETAQLLYTIYMIWDEMSSENTLGRNGQIGAKNPWDEISLGLNGLGPNVLWDQMALMGRNGLGPNVSWDETALMGQNGLGPNGP